jgi:predicted TPR repeat methyltransferase
MLRQDDGASPSPPAALAERLASAARTALRAQRPREALPSLDRLRLLPGEAARAAALRAEALLELGQAEAADEAAATALALEPGDAWHLLLRARAHHACGRLLDALDTAAAAVVARPTDRSALVLFAGLLLADGRFRDAVQVVEDALRHYPEDPGLLLRLGIALRCDGRHADSAAILDDCARLAPALPDLALAQAQTALARGEIDSAIAIAEAGLRQIGADAGLYSILGHALEKAGRGGDAMAALRAASRLAPEDAYLAHLVATAEGVTPERAGAGYVSTLFDGYAPHFEASLIGLGYRVPGLIRLTLDRLRPGAAPLGPVLDLGCGTGLVGVALLDRLGAALVGVDLSGRMLKEARAKQIYTELQEADLLDALRNGDQRYDLIIAADVFCYLGQLETVLAACTPRLANGGLLLFSVERGAEGSGYRLHRQGRYTHAPDLLRADLTAAGLLPIEMREEVLRHNGGKPVDGLLVIARAATS